MFINCEWLRPLMQPQRSSHPCWGKTVQWCGCFGVIHPHVGSSLPWPVNEPIKPHWSPKLGFNKIVLLLVGVLPGEGRCLLISSQGKSPPRLAWNLLCT